MLKAKFLLIKYYLIASLPFVLIGFCFILGNLFGKFLVRYQKSKISQIIKKSSIVFLIICSLVLWISYKGIYDPVTLKLIFLTTFLIGLLSRPALSFLKYKNAKGSIHDKSPEFYLGSSIPLHNKYNYGLENNVVKSAILTHHQLIYGASGSGKTFSTLQPQCYFDIKWSRRLFVIDPKGDLDFCNSVYSYAKHFNKEQDFFFFSITNPQKSYAFNPLLGITNNEIKDLIISCTEWSEPYYKKMAEMMLLEILEKMESPTLSSIEKKIPNEMEFKGLKADLKIMCKSDFGRLIDREDVPSLEDLHAQNRICFFSLNTQAYPEASKQLGRIILGSLMALSNKIQSQVEPKARKETTIIVDEFGSFITETFINFLNKARSSKFRLILATQSPGDVELDGTKTRKQIADSTTIKMFLRVSDPESAEYCSSVVGTHQVEKRTSRVDDRNFHSDTYTGSIREVQEFIIHPDDIKKFGVGEGVIYTQSPFSISRVKFDFTNKFNIPIFSYLDSKIAKDVDDFNLLKSKQKIKQEQIPTIKDIELIP